MTQVMEFSRWGSFVLQYNCITLFRKPVADKIEHVQ